MKRDAKYWIDRLKLVPHPEGGYYRSTFRSPIAIARESLPSRFKGPRLASSSVYFLLDDKNFSAFHRLQADELWHFYAGSAVIIHIVDPAGIYSELRIGSDPESGEVFQGVVKAGCWFGARLLSAAAGTGASAEAGKGTSAEASEDRPPTASEDSAAAAPFALVGCTVSPGFDFEDFELAKRADLIAQFPQHRAVIEQLTRA